MNNREYQRLYARRQREQKLDMARQTTTTCPARFGQGRCGGTLFSETDGHGHARVRCAWCERRCAGICRDCPAPVAGRVRSALRCARHKVAAERASIRRYQVRNRELLNDRAREYYTEPQNAARRNEYQKAWRKIYRERVKAQKRRSNLRGVGQAYQAKRREKLRRAGLLTPNHRPVPRSCITCPTVVRGRVKKCLLCKERERLEALVLLQRMVA